MDRKIFLRTQGLGKRADELGDSFAGAVNDMAAQQLKSDALKDVRNLGLAALGVGLAGRGAVGLYNVITRNKSKKDKSGPAILPLPYPVKAGSVSGFLAGDMASTKSGIPWYGPAMLGAGMGGLYLGWKGMDTILDARRKIESEAALEQARRQFREALVSQYDAPLSGLPKKKKEEEKVASDSPMEKAGAALDRVWGSVARVLNDYQIKQSLDVANLGGIAAGGYGTYAGLAGLLTGALVYQQMKKRSRQAVLEKAIQKRDRRRFMQSPTELYAVPDPMEVEG